MMSTIHCVTVSTNDLVTARKLYADALGMQIQAEWDVTNEDAAVRCLWGLPEGVTGQGLWLQQPGAKRGAIRLLRFDGEAAARGVPANDKARPYDHGLIKNLDFFTDEVETQYARLMAMGVSFTAPPVTYPVPWGRDVTSTETHLPTADGVKLALLRMNGVARRVFGESLREAMFTEVAAATQIVRDYERAVQFYVEVFDCVPAAETVIDDPHLISMLKLPVGTRLRMSFIGPRDAVSGKIGIVAYEGEGVADARSLQTQSRPPNRGAVMLTFETEDVDHRHARALLNGAREICPPTELVLPPVGLVRASSFTSPDGILLELFSRIAIETEKDEDFVPALRLNDCLEGRLESFTVPGIGRMALLRFGKLVFAVEDRCPHLNGSLSKGSLHGHVATCPWHGWQIDITTGVVVGCATTQAHRFQVRVVKDKVFIKRTKTRREHL